MEFFMTDILNHVLLTCFTYLKKITVGSCCMSVNPTPSPSELFNALSNLYEIWHVYYDTWTRIKVVLYTSSSIVEVKVKVMLRLTVSQSVSQYVLVSSSLWNLWPDIIFCLKVAVLSLWSALSDERSGLSPVSHCHQCLPNCKQINIIYIVHVTCFKYMQYILDLCQHRLSTADHAKIYATTAI
jgi:hypothetical protein